MLALLLQRLRGTHWVSTKGSRTNFRAFQITDGSLLGLYVKYSDMLRRDVRTVASKQHE
jgi:hypothetical protein